MTMNKFRGLSISRAVIARKIIATLLLAVLLATDQGWLALTSANHNDRSPAQHQQRADQQIRYNSALASHPDERSRTQQRLAQVPKNQDGADRFLQILDELKRKDACGSLFTAKKYGFDIQEHKVVTKDNYELTLHRIVHPSDFATNGPRPSTKKPYLFIHGLIGSSASFLRNTKQDYKPPGETFDSTDPIEGILAHKLADYQYNWQPTAERFGGTFEDDKSGVYEELSLTQRLLKRPNWKQYAQLNEIDCDGDTISFGREFKQAHRKFDLPRAAKGHVANSLAFTMSNFGYDVWLVNLRGNYYSRRYNGRLNTEDAEYWDFNIDTIIKEDLLAVINKVKGISQPKKHIGLVSYSYSSLHVLGLLRAFPAYQETLQPVVLMAPTLMTSSAQSTKLKLFLKMVSSTLMAHNGPFPALARSKHDHLERLVCKLPIASKLCNLFETVMHGRVKSVRDLVFDDQQGALVKKDVECGQTSLAVLHQVVENLSDQKILFKYQPSDATRVNVMRGKPVRRSVVLVHSESDDISTMEEVNKIKNVALRLNTLVDLVIKEPKFGHTDFLFSKRNQYLVNAEIVRIATLFDHLVDRPGVNEPLVRARGY